MGGSVFKKSKKNEVFSCNRSMKQIQDLQKLILWRGGVLRAIKRSIFEGFYTAVLEKNDEIITVVTLRVHGYKVAEIPFVATTLRYRRLGMCRMLMDEVERMLRGLGVEIIVLPASTDKVSTWTQSFGFSEMTDI
nr:increased DNA methylation 1-like [Tanacetum cinerariifolium]